jgi:hypothetical protein
MVRVIGLILLTIVISSFNISETKNYFEGTVTYQLSYKPIHENATVAFLEENYGVIEIMHYKNGFYKKISLNRKGDTVKTIVHNPITKMMYGTHILSGDTIMKYSSLDNIMKGYKKTKVTNEQVLGYKTYGIQLDYEISQDFVLYGIENQVMTFYFSKKLKIDSENHKNQKDGFYDEIINENPYLILKSVDDDKFIKIETKTAFKIIEDEIDDSIFEIDGSKPIIKI